MFMRAAFCLFAKECPLVRHMLVDSYDKLLSVNITVDQRVWNFPGIFVSQRDGQVQYVVAWRLACTEGPPTLYGPGHTNQQSTLSAPVPVEHTVVGTSSIYPPSDPLSEIPPPLARPR